MRYQPSMAITHKHISQLDWHQLNDAVHDGVVSVDAATNEVLGSYTLQRNAIEARIISSTQSRVLGGWPCFSTLHMWRGG